MVETTKLDDGSDPATTADLFDRLDGLDIAYSTVDHQPVFTVEEAKALRGELPGAHIKNLMLRNKKGAMWLVVCSRGSSDRSQGARSAARGGQVLVRLCRASGEVPRRDPRRGDPAGGDQRRGWARVRGSGPSRPRPPARQLPSTGQLHDDRAVASRPGALPGVGETSAVVDRAALAQPVQSLPPSALRTQGAPRSAESPP